ncbi:MAG TPA: hypothetical protein VKR29_00930 [Candidatus Binataceae bacterium]|nr:hypothetical protein [Candidatus Binataceae bacterium]
MRIVVACLGLLMFAATSFAQPAPFEPPAGRVIFGSCDAELAGAPRPPAMIGFQLGANSQQVADFMRRYRGFAATHGFFIAQIGLSFRGDEHDVSTGMRDPEVIALADGLREVGRAVLLRIGYDFNAPGALYESSAYIGGFRHAVDRMRQDHLDFASVWDASAAGFSDPHYMKWYPGDDVVDWWGVDFGSATELDSAETKSFLDAAAHHHKPVAVSLSLAAMKSDTDALKLCEAAFNLVHSNPDIKAVSLCAIPHLGRWKKTAAYLKQQLADPRFIEVNEVPAMFRPKQSED